MIGEVLRERLRDLVFREMLLELLRDLDFREKLRERLRVREVLRELDCWYRLERVMERRLDFDLDRRVVEDLMASATYFLIAAKISGLLP